MPAPRPVYPSFSLVMSLQQQQCSKYRRRSANRTIDPSGRRYQRPRRIVLRITDTGDTVDWAMKTIDCREEEVKSRDGRPLTNVNEELLSYAESLLPNVPHPVPMQDMRVVLRPADDDATSEISVLDLNNSKEKYVLPSKIESLKKSLIRRICFLRVVARPAVDEKTDLLG